MITQLEENLLIMLSSRKEAYGLEMINTYKQVTGHKLGFGSFYPIMSKLARNKLAAVNWVERRKYFSITALGIKELKKMGNIRLQLIGLEHTS